MIKRTLLRSLLLTFPFLFSAEYIPAQMVGTNAFIKATYAEIGVSGIGGFEGAPVTTLPAGMHYRPVTGSFGFVANPQVNAWATFDGDFFTPGTKENGWGIEFGTAAATNYSNNCASPQMINGALTWDHTFNCYKIDWIGTLTTPTNVTVKISYLLMETDLYYTTTVSITNNTAATIPDMYYYRNVDPDNNQSIGGGFNTQNTIVSQPFSGACNMAHVKATSNLPASQPMSYLGLAGVGANWRAGYGGFTNRDASNMWYGTGFTQTVGATANADAAIFLAYRIQNLAPGATETFKFVVILDDAAAAQAINNSTYLTYTGSATAPPAACTPYVDTVTACQGVPAPISITGPNTTAFTWTWSPATGLSSTTGPSVMASPPTTTTYTITGTPTSPCFAPITIPFVVKINPSPVINAVPPAASYCAGATVPATAFSSTPAGATYTWTNSNPAIGLAGSGTGNLPSFVATNTTGADITATITVTPTVAGNPCPGLPSTYTITVKANPVVLVNSATICPGQTATLTASGATTYLWSTGSSANPISVSPLVTTSYTVTGTTNGCTGTAVATVTMGGTLPVAVNSPTICAGQSATLTVTGATTYLWNTGSVSNPLTVTPAATTSYTVTGTTTGCTGTAVATVTVNPLPVTTSSSSTICNGSTATLTAGGAASYAWSTGDLTATAVVSPGATSTYTVTGTTLGCSSTATGTVTVNPIPVTTVNSPNICPGASATLTAGGAASYVWSTAETMNPISVTPSGTSTYTVTGTSLGCSSTAVSTVTVAPLMVVSITPVTICTGSVASLTASGAASYVWSAGATATGTNTADASPSATTTYTVTGTLGSCTQTGTGTVTVNPIPLTTLSSTAICDGSTAGLTAGGADSYSWSAGATSTGINTADASPTVTTTYTVTGTSLGCSATASGTVTVNPIPVTAVNSPSICPGSSATLTATGATSYVWSTAETTSSISVTPAGTSTYTVTGTSLGCSSTAVSTVSVNPVFVPDAGINDTICFGGSSNLSVVPNGPGYTYAWAGAGLSATNIYNPVASPASTTDYTVTVTDALGCSGTDVVQVFTDPEIILAIAGLPASCNATCDGQTIVIPSGGTPSFTYVWSSGCTGAACNAVCAGSYSVTVTDALGCIASSSTVVTEPTPVSVVLSSITANCNLPDGSATVTASGGTPFGGSTYNYLWTDGQTTSTAVNLIPGSYCVQVSDANGCVSDPSLSCITVANAPGVVASILSQTPASCNGVCDATATAGGTGGISPYTFAWNTVPVQTTPTATGLCAGTYVCTVTDASGCTSTSSVTITEPTPVVVAPIASMTICTAASANFTASASGGNPGTYTYTWSPGGMTGATQTVTPAATTVYTVNASDVNGCPAAPVSMTVTVNPPLTVATAGTASICPGGSATISATASNGNGGPYNYTWSPGGMTGSTASVSPAVSTVYTVTASDGCSPAATATVTITVLPVPNPVIGSTPVSGCEPLCVTFNDLSTVASGSIASAAWDFGDGNAAAGSSGTNCYASAGSYSVSLTVISSDGCISSLTNTNMITVHPLPDANATAQSTTVSIVDPLIQFIDNSSNAATWSWDFGDPLAANNTSVLQNPSHFYNEAGSYCATVVVTSPFGCQDNTTVCIIVEPEFTFYIPNGFTPNGDGINDEFYGKGDFIVEFQMSIYDRWGNLIFFSDDMDKHWDGKANHGAEIVQQDTYVYVVKLKDFKDKSHTYMGTVTIVK